MEYWCLLHGVGLSSKVVSWLLYNSHILVNVRETYYPTPSQKNIPFIWADLLVANPSTEKIGQWWKPSWDCARTGHLQQVQSTEPAPSSRRHTEYKFTISYREHAGWTLTRCMPVHVLARSLKDMQTTWYGITHHLVVTLVRPRNRLHACLLQLLVQRTPAATQSMKPFSFSSCCHFFPLSEIFQEPPLFISLCCFKLLNLVFLCLFLSYPLLSFCPSLYCCSANVWYIFFHY